VAITAELAPAEQANLTWRGVVYDTWLMPKLMNRKPVLSPPPSDPLFTIRPH